MTYHGWWRIKWNAKSRTEDLYSNEIHVTYPNILSLKHGQ